MDEWLGPDEAERAERFLAVFGERPTAEMIPNLAAALQAGRFGEVILPCTLSSRPTCYLCSPSVAYADYAEVELAASGAGWLARTALIPVLALGRLLIAVARLDRQLQINNWLLSTNPPPVMAASQAGRIAAELTKNYPRHVLYWRSLNAVSDSRLLDQLREAGWILIPARMVYLFDCRSAPPRVHQNERRDNLLLAKSPYRVTRGTDFAAADFSRAEKLYEALYLDKYTQLNPRYSALFLRRMRDAGLLDLHGLRNDAGVLDGVIGFFDGGAVMTAPIVGYDTSLPPALGLYRALMAIGFERARCRRMLFNISAGAGSFKRLRGATPALEYSAVYNRHLAWPRRFAARVLAALLTRIAVPFLERFEL